MSTGEKIICVLIVSMLIFVVATIVTRAIQGEDQRELSTCHPFAPLGKVHDENAKWYVVCKDVDKFTVKELK